MNWLSDTSSIVIAIAAVLTFYTALLHLNRRHINRLRVFRAVRGLVTGIQTFQLYCIARNL